MNKIKVSICIPTYKQVEYLKKNLESVLSQDYEDFEIIITDDTPNDDVKNLVKLFNFKRKIKYYKNTKIKGSPENWNEAMKYAKGKYIKILHHDDWFIKRSSLRKFVKMLDDNPEIDFAFSNTLIWEIQNNRYRLHKVTNEQLKSIEKDPYVLFFSNIIGAPSATIFRNNPKVRFDNKLKWLVDIDFYIRLLKSQSTFCYCPEELVCTPTGLSGQVTESCLNNRRVELFEYIHIYRKIYKTSKIYKVKFFFFFVKLFNKYKIYSFNKLQSFSGNILFQKDFFKKAIMYSRFYVLLKYIPRDFL